nr:Protein of unknown function DUF1759 and Zinc finger and Protein of unknown function DUF1758 domain containing protein [Haemonchus contortus]
MVWELTATAKLVSEALANFTSIADSLMDPLPEEENEKVQTQVEKAHRALHRAQKLAIELEAHRVSAREHAVTNQETDDTGTVVAARLKLAPIPIPTFTGKVWEFENFWALFAANVHNQPLSPLQKFNYLINALRGEARETIRRFAITEANYESAIEFLHAKYGDESRLICCLQSRLEDAKAHSTSLAGQRHLLEQLMPIVTQLEAKGVSLNGSFLAQKILAKFTNTIQRKALEFRMTSPMREEMWKVKEILADIDKIIDTEERINHMVHNLGRDEWTHAEPTRLNKTIHRSHQGNAPCMFCHSNEHKSVNCPKCATLEERRHFFRENNKCLNCGASGHFTRDCTKAGCRICEGRKHHHTLCPQRTRTNYLTAETAHQRSHPSRRSIGNRENSRNEDNARIKKPTRMQVNATDTAVCTTSAITHRQGSDTSLCTAATNGARERDIDHNSRSAFQQEKGNDARGVRVQESPAKDHNVWLLTGVARVRDTPQNRWRRVEVLLDTGANQSFISEELANELGFIYTADREFSIHTFGSDKPKRARCGLIKLDIEDAQGNSHELKLYTTPVVTMGSRTAQLSGEDLAFIDNHQISLSKLNWESPSKPQILVGCDQLWAFLDTPQPRFQLPSGLQLIPSKLGYLLTGRQDNTSGLNQSNTTYLEDVSLNTLTNFDEELERWDKYWTMDSAGVCEFTGSKNAEKEATNKQVDEFFEATIQKRSDGYYVRLPYKENHPPLPTNKAIALNASTLL